MRRLPNLFSLIMRVGNGNRVGAPVHTTRCHIYGISMNQLLPTVTDKTESVHY
ncbi:hypothetical protein BCF11_1769 [Collimonas sp. PA-H2]|nr:hypothetical protein BCF11_1769 [Collimonas sp. PA-H2]